MVLSPLSTDPTEWHHVVCKFEIGMDPATATATLMVDGDVVVRNGALPVAVPATELSFLVGSATPVLYSFAGEVDELFTSQILMTDSMIAKIHACGIEGSLCECEADELASYRTVGRENSTELPACRVFF